MQDYTLECGCFQRTERANNGRVIWVDEALCAEHATELLNAPPPATDHRFTWYSTDVHDNDDEV